MTRPPAAVAKIACRSPDAIDPVEALRRRISGSTARDHVVLDFLSDDLREARTAIAGVAAYLSSVEAALAEELPSQDRILGLALGGGPMGRIEYLGEVLGNVRRRLAQVAARI